MNYLIIITLCILDFLLYGWSQLGNEGLDSQQPYIHKQHIGEEVKPMHTTEQPRLVTVYTHRGVDIQTMSPAAPDQFGYIIKLPALQSETFDQIDEAIDEVENYLGKE